MQQTINSRNYAVSFRKSAEEKQILADLKKANKLQRMNVYGNDYKRHLNIPDEQNRVINSFENNIKS